jgi:GntR family transcriptional regulator/MocR family aminotransferase
MLAEQAPAVAVSGIAAGLQVLARLPDRDEGAVIAAAADHGLALQGLGHYAHPGQQHHPPALVIGYGTPPDHAYTSALARLGAVLSG